MIAGCPCTCLLLPLLVNIAVVFASLSPTTTLAYPAPQVITRRWFNPCYGDDPISIPTTTAATPTTTSGPFAAFVFASRTSGFATTSGSFVTPSDAHLADSFHAISSKATRLKRHVRELKDLYVCMPLRLHDLC